jgi:hypothetical protein
VTLSGPNHTHEWVPSALSVSIHTSQGSRHATVPNGFAEVAASCMAASRVKQAALDDAPAIENGRSGGHSVHGSSRDPRPLFDQAPFLHRRSCQCQVQRPQNASDGERGPQQTPCHTAPPYTTHHPVTAQ